MAPVSVNPDHVREFKSAKALEAWYRKQHDSAPELWLRVFKKGSGVASVTITEALDVRPSGVDRAARTLSGGNQQKVVLARWLLRDCRVLLLDEPTRGVDVGARSEIYNLVRALADRGVAVVVVSSEVEEVLGLADQVLVVREGAIVHRGPAADIDEHQVLDLVMAGSAV